MRRRPPHILVTTPESLYILLGSESGRAMLATTRTVIVDEIHALAPNKRGAHLALSLERLDALCGDRLQRIGLSATQKPIETVARFLVGAGADGGTPDARSSTPATSARATSRSKCPPSPLEAVMSDEVWEQVYDRLAELVAEHRTTLVFVNTRRMAERVARHLAERLGEEHVAAHHGSLAKELRLDAEQRLKRGELKALVATASLELGIDIGDVDLVCQLGSPRSIASLPAARRPLRPRGRRHAEGPAVPAVARRAGRMRGAARQRAPRRARSRCTIPEQPLDVLAQQIVAEVAAREWNEDELFALLRRAWPYRDAGARAISTRSCACWPRASPPAAAGAARSSIATRSIGMLRGRRGARLTALTSGGTIPDTADYQVLLEPREPVDRHGQRGLRGREPGRRHLPARQHVLPHPARRARRGARRGRARRSRRPFRSGSARRRAAATSCRTSVSRLRDEIAARLRATARTRARRAGSSSEVGIARAGAPSSSSTTSPRAHAALGCLPTQDTIVLERFFDEAGGMQLVIHSPFGSRINRAWGLALRKRFCRKFNFELQAAATEDNIVLSLDHRAQLRARRGRALSAFGQRARRADPGAARRADVQHALALGRRRRARAAALPRRQEGAAAARAHGGRGPDRARSSPTRSPAPRTSSASARSPTIRWSPDDRRLPERGDGHRRAGAAAARGSRRARSASSRAT